MDEVNKKQKEIELLEKDPVVRKYLKAKKQLKDMRKNAYTLLDEEKIIEKAISSVSIETVNEIYVYMGSFLTVKEDESTYSVKVDYEDETAEFRIYRSVERTSNQEGYEVCMPINECEKFEEENIVIMPTAQMEGEEYYNKYRKKYFNDAIRYGETDAYYKAYSKKNMQNYFRNKINKEN